MKIIYSDQQAGFLPGYEYRNPQYFQAPLGRPDKVIVMGHWPAIVQAYRDLGVEVEERPAFASNIKRAVVDLPAPPKALTDAAGKPQLDHDGDGKAGGSTASEQTDDLKALRDEYRKVIGKKAFPGWGREVLLAKIEESRGG